jgi:uncharacterized protein
VENRPDDKRYWPQYCKYFKQPTNFTSNTGTMKPLEIIHRYYKRDSKAYNILVTHSQLVTDKALWIAQRHPELNPDPEFIEEAGMLHDIGIIKTHAPDLGCFGELPYLCHGYLGREMLETEGLNEHALVCERHTGVGITAEDVIRNKLPLPERDFVPESVEEQIICFADKFYSKSKNLKKEKSLTEIRNSIGRFGQKNITRFDEWCKLFL